MQPDSVKIGIILHFKGRVTPSIRAESVAAIVKHEDNVDHIIMRCVSQIVWYDCLRSYNFAVATPSQTSTLEFQLEASHA
jgi:hypothetical protein